MDECARPAPGWAGPELLAAFASATAWLGANAASVNALNVFPVPDGDTGTNMSLTLQAGLAEAQAKPSARAGEVAQAVAHGALMGARGNSGVILSQVLRGFARALADQETVGVPHLVRALREASNTAYRGVMKPVEGTILTVIREAAEAAERVESEVGDPGALFERVVAAARNAVARTPTLLPVLQQAGVVDAGGQGLALILEGFARYARGEADGGVVAPSAAELLDLAAEAHAAFGDIDPGAVYGYCTEFVILGEHLDLAAIRAELERQGDSVLAVGDETTVRVHLHTRDPGQALSYAGALGQLTRIKIDNMQLQREQFVGAGSRQAPTATAAAAPPLPAATGRTATIAVAAGEGLQRLFASLGATRVVPGGQTMNPSTQELLEAVEAVPSDEVLLLPNNKNIVLTAGQVVQLTRKRLAVVPTTTIPQGIAALFAYNYDADLETNARAMTEAARRARTVEVTTAVRSVTLNGLAVQAGSAIALVDGELALTGANEMEVALGALERADLDTCELVTIYTGAGVGSEAVARLAQQIEARWPNTTVETVDGGQPHYQYIIQLE